MNFDDHFDLLNKVNDNEKKINKNCCLDYGNFIFKDEEYYCKICDNLITNIIDSPEWRYYGSSDSKNTNPTRCGMPINVLLPDSSLGSSVKKQNNNEVMNKISMYQNWNSMPYKERSLYKVFNDIQSKCTENNLPEIISSTAKSLYKIISDNKISRGSNRIGIIAACVYNACKECNVPRSIKEISKIFNIKTTVMTKGCKNFDEIMRFNKINKNRNIDNKSINLNDFIERFSYKLSIPQNDINNILILSKLCEKINIIHDNTPPSMAVGCIFLYIKNKKLNINKKYISEICEISEVTINKCYKKLSVNKDIIDLFQQEEFN